MIVYFHQYKSMYTFSTIKWISLECTAVQNNFLFLCPVALFAVMSYQPTMWGSDPRVCQEDCVLHSLWLFMSSWSPQWCGGCVSGVGCTPMWNMQQKLPDQKPAELLGLKLDLTPLPAGPYAVVKTCYCPRVLEAWLSTEDMGDGGPLSDGA